MKSATPAIENEWRNPGTFLDPAVINTTPPAHIPATSAEVMALMEETIKRFDAVFESLKPVETIFNPSPALDYAASKAILSRKGRSFPSFINGGLVS